MVCIGLGVGHISSKPCNLCVLILSFFYIYIYVAIIIASSVHIQATIVSKFSLSNYYFTNIVLSICLLVTIS